MLVKLVSKVVSGGRVEKRESNAEINQLYGFCQFISNKNLLIECWSFQETLLGLIPNRTEFKHKESLHKENGSRGRYSKVHVRKLREPAEVTRINVKRGIK